MRAFSTLTGKAIPLGLSNIDTDVIITTQHLKTISREGLGRVALAALRADPSSVLNDPRYAGAPILIAGDNFGCGSSREHAAWALADMGLRAIIAPSFGDIFAGNAFKNGLLLVALPQAQVDHLLQQAATAEITVDLESQSVTTSHQDGFQFAIDRFRKNCLLKGLDEIDLTLQMSDERSAFEARLASDRPWITS